MKDATGKRDGFVLVMTLVLIAMAAVRLASIAQHSLALSLASHEAAEQLQQRWGAASCQRVGWRWPIRS